MTNSNLFIISGGPGAGKTTSLLELEKFGFPEVPEAARQIIQEQTQLGGTALPWGDREAYTALMLERSIDLFQRHTPASKPLFADCGIPDTLCYARLIGLRDVQSIENACRLYRYAPVVFLAPPWSEIYETDSERKQDFAQAERTYNLMAEVYQECGYRIISLPKVTRLARAQFILERLHLGG